MKSELVDKTKTMLGNMYSALCASHEQSKKERPETEKEFRKGIRKDVDKMNDIIRDINEDNVESKFDSACELVEELNSKYQLQIEIPSIPEPDIPELTDPEESDNLDEEEKTSVDESNKCGAAKVIGGILAVTALAGIAYHTGAKLGSCNSCSGSRSLITEVEETEIPEETIKPTATTATPTATPTVTPSATPEVTPTPALTLGEYGTFFDVEDEEQVNARAQYIYDNYFANNTSLTEEQKQLITVEKIANTIRVMNGVLPLDKDGNAFLKGNTLNDYSNVLYEMVVNVGSNDNLNYTYFPAYLLAVDGSEESEYIKSYSPIYEKLVYALNEHDDEQVQDAIACLGYKFYNEWYLQGMYEGFENPHFLRTDVKYLTFISTIEPFFGTALEWHLSERKPVCIEACVDYNTGEKELLTVNAIANALRTGAWSDVSAKLAGNTVYPVSWIEEYFEALNSSLESNYKHRNALTLNNNN